MHKSPEEAARDPLHGNLFENMVIAEAFKACLNHNREPRLYFWRDSNYNEIDLIHERQRRLCPVEIKSARTWHPSLADGLRRFRRNMEEV